MGGAPSLWISQILGTAEEWWDSGFRCAGTQHHVRSVPAGLSESPAFTPGCSFVPSMILVPPIPARISLSSQLFSHFEKGVLTLSTFNIVSFPGHISFPLSLALSVYLALVLSLHREMQSHFVPFPAICAEQPTFAWVSWLPVQLVWVLPQACSPSQASAPSQSQNPSFCFACSQSDLAIPSSFLCHHSNSWFLPILLTPHNMFPPPFLPVA